jgi:MFS family permease
MYGRKLMMIRASLGLAIAMSLIGMAQDVWQLVALRLLAGLLGGYSSGSTILVATQTPNARSGWALGMLASGIMAGNLVGPLVGGVLPPLIGIRQTFLAAGAVIFVAFLATAFLIKEEARPPRPKTAKRHNGWGAIPDKRPIVAMLATGLLFMFANMSIEPIITVYVAQLVEDSSHVTLVSGVAMSAAALGSILSASRLGKLADRAGHRNVIIGCLLASAVLLIPQAFVNAGWQLVGLRFLMGVALGGLVPCIAAVIKHNVPDNVAGNMLGYSTSAQYAGLVAGPLAGGFVGGHIGMRAVFLGTSVLMAGGAAYNWWASSRAGDLPHSPDPR